MQPTRREVGEVTAMTSPPTEENAGEEENTHAISIRRKPETQKRVQCEQKVATGVQVAVRMTTHEGDNGREKRARHVVIVGV